MFAGYTVNESGEAKTCDYWHCQTFQCSQFHLQKTQYAYAIIRIGQIYIYCIAFYSEGSAVEVTGGSGIKRSYKLMQ